MKLALPLLQVCASALPPHKAQIQHEERLLYTSRSMSSSREGVTSAGIRNGAWKAICWEGARSWLGEDAPFSLPLLSAQLGGFQASAWYWLLLCRSINTPSLPVPLPVMLHFFRLPNVY